MEGGSGGGFVTDADYEAHDDLFQNKNKTLDNECLLNISLTQSLTHQKILYTFQPWIFHSSIH